MAKTTSHHLHDGASGAAITVHVIHPASKNEVIKVDEGIVHIRLSGANANHALLAYLAGILNVPQKKLEIVGGEKGSDKLVTILDLDSATVQERILAVLG